MIIKLKSADASVLIDSFGSQLVSFQDEYENEYLWQGDKQFWAGQAPVLFPTVGSLRAKSASIDGKIYSMERHGFARRREFRVQSQTAVSAHFELCADEDTKKMFPFDFLLVVGFSLAGKILTQSFAVTNRDQHPMPFGVGAHPGFCVPLEEDESFEDYAIRFETSETADCPYLDEEGLLVTKQARPVLKNEQILPLTHELFDYDALVFDRLKSRTVQLFSRLSGRGVRVSFNGFDYLGIWSAKGKAPFVCIEPWTCTATCDTEDDVFEHKRGIQTLSPGETAEYMFQMEIL